ncbi:hypothetical protein LTR53_010925 [Teratosphaeriaceae sp. CCFEE 6253]|nr:hypothetical protein LTR53_010925 [Teratosphaeriaceae sp. CCFEE 6253]
MAAAPPATPRADILASLDNALRPDVNAADRKRKKLLRSIQHGSHDDVLAQLVPWISREFRLSHALLECSIQRRAKGNGKELLRLSKARDDAQVEALQDLGWAGPKMGARVAGLQVELNKGRAELQQLRQEREAQAVELLAVNTESKRLHEAREGREGQLADAKKDLREMRKVQLAHAEELAEEKLYTRRLRDEEDVLRAELFVLQNQNLTHSVDLETARNRIRDLEGTLKREQQSKREAEVMSEGLQGQTFAAKDQAENAERRYQSLESAHRRLDETMKKATRRTNRRAEALHADKQALMAELEACQQGRQDAQTCNDDLRQQLDDATANITSATQAAQTAIDIHEQQQREILATARSETTRALERATKLEADKLALATTITDLRSASDEARAHLQTQLAETIYSLADRESTITRLHLVARTQDSRITEAESEIRELKECARRAEGRCEEMRAEVGMAEEKAGGADKRMRDLVAEKESLENVSKRLQAELDVSKCLHREADAGRLRTLETAQTQARALQAVLVKARATANAAGVDLSSQLTKAEFKVSQAGKRVTALEAELADLKRAAEDERARFRSAEQKHGSEQSETSVLLYDTLKRAKMQLDELRGLALSIAAGSLGDEGTPHAVDQLLAGIEFPVQEREDDSNDTGIIVLRLRGLAKSRLGYNELERTYESVAKELGAAGARVRAQRDRAVRAAEFEAGERWDQWEAERRQAKMSWDAVSAALAIEEAQRAGVEREMADLRQASIDATVTAGYERRESKRVTGALELRCAEAERQRDEVVEAAEDLQSRHESTVADLRARLELEHAHRDVLKEALAIAQRSVRRAEEDLAVEKAADERRRVELHDSGQALDAVKARLVRTEDELTNQRAAGEREQMKSQSLEQELVVYQAKCKSIGAALVELRVDRDHLGRALDASTASVKRAEDKLAGERAAAELERSNARTLEGELATQRTQCLSSSDTIQELLATQDDLGQALDAANAATRRVEDSLAHEKAAAELERGNSRNFEQQLFVYQAECKSSSDALVAAGTQLTSVRSQRVDMEEMMHQQLCNADAKIEERGATIAKQLRALAAKNQRIARLVRNYEELRRTLDTAKRDLGWYASRVKKLEVEKVEVRAVAADLKHTRDERDELAEALALCVKRAESAEAARRVLLAAKVEAGMKLTDQTQEVHRLGSQSAEVRAGAVRTQAAFTFSRWLLRRAQTERATQQAPTESRLDPDRRGDGSVGRECNVAAVGVPRRTGEVNTRTRRETELEAEQAIVGDKACCSADSQRRAQLIAVSEELRISQERLGSMLAAEVQTSRTLSRARLAHDEARGEADDRAQRLAAAETHLSATQQELQRMARRAGARETELKSERELLEAQIAEAAARVDDSNRENVRLRQMAVEAKQANRSRSEADASGLAVAADAVRACESRSHELQSRLAAAETRLEAAEAESDQLATALDEAHCEAAKQTLRQLEAARKKSGAAHESRLRELEDQLAVTAIECHDATAESDRLARELGQALEDKHDSLFVTPARTLTRIKRVCADDVEPLAVPSVETPLTREVNAEDTAPDETRIAETPVASEPARSSCPSRKRRRDNDALDDFVVQDREDHGTASKRRRLRDVPAPSPELLDNIVVATRREATAPPEEGPALDALHAASTIVLTVEQEASRTHVPRMLAQPTPSPSLVLSEARAASCDDSITVATTRLHATAREVGSLRSEAGRQASSPPFVPRPAGPNTRTSASPVENEAGRLYASNPWRRARPVAFALSRMFGKL